MARARMLRATFFSSQRMGTVSRDARLLFAGLWVVADDEGRLPDNARLILGEVFPWDPDVREDDVRLWLNQLETIGSIRRYNVNGGDYIYIPKWSKHQKPQHPTLSSLPPPPDTCSEELSTPPENDSGETHEPLTKNSPQVRLGQVRSGQGTFGVTPQEPKPTPDGTKQAPDPGLDIVGNQLATRFHATLRPRNRTSLELVRTATVVTHLRKWISDQIIDELIGRIIETNTEPGSARYLLMAGRNWATENLPGVKIPDVPGLGAAPPQRRTA
jgi:hypothetical protein